MNHAVRAALCATVALAMLLPPIPGSQGGEGAAPDPGHFVWKDAPFHPAGPNASQCQAPIARGVIKVLILAIQFTDVKHDPAHTTGTIDALGDGTNSLNTYYLNASFGRVSITTACFGWYNSTQTLAHYGAPSAFDHDSLNLYGLVTEAVNAANAEVDFSQYDQNNDGWVDYLMIVHAGDDQATSGVPNDIWSHAGYDVDTPTVDGKRVGLYSMMAETSPMGVLAHEFGHQLGLPDLYDTDGADSGGETSGAGLWDIMAAGNYLGGGSTPAMPSAWSRVKLGWADVVVIGANTDDFILGAAEQCSTVMRVNLPGHPKEYFLLENRQKTGYDAYLPGAGLLIWHIDESRGSVNSNNLEVAPGKKYVTLEEAHGGRMDLDSTGSMNLGDSRDPWYNNIIGFTPGSDPNSSAASDGKLTFISVKRIGAAGLSMSLSVQLDTPVYDLRLTAPSPSLVKVDPAGFASYTVTFNNLGSVNEFNLSVEGARSEWSRPSQPTIKLGYLEMGSVAVTVQPPANMPANLTVTNTFKASPISNAFISYGIEVTVKINPRFRGVFAPSRDLALVAGERRLVNMTVSNQGNLQDTISMAMTGSGLGWVDNPGPTAFTLSAGANTTFSFWVSIPWGTQENARTFVTVGGRSQDGTPCNGATLNLTASPSRLYEVRTPGELHVKPGVGYNFMVQLVNAGTSDVDLALTAAVETGWYANLSQAVVSVPAWSSQEIPVLLTPAPDAPAGLVSSVKINATTAGNLAVAVVPVTVEHVFGARIAACDTVADLMPGVAYAYDLVIANSGNGQDELTFSLEEGEGGQDWSVTLDALPARLKAGENTTVTVTVTPPEKALATTEWHLNLSARHSNGEATVFELVSRVARLQKLSMTSSAPSKSGMPGEALSFTLTVTNHGNWQELVVFSLPRLNGLNTEFDKEMMALDPDATDNVKLTCRLISGALAGLRSFNVTASPESNLSANATLNLKVTVNTIYGADLAMADERKGCDAGQSVVFQMTVTNRGNSPDNFTLSKLAGTAGVSFDRPVISLRPGESGKVNLTVSVPAGETGGARSIKISVRSQGKAGEVALKELTVDVRAKDATTAAVIAIPLVAAVVVAVAGALAGLWYVRSRKRSPSLVKGAPGAGKGTPGADARGRPPSPPVQATAPATKAPAPAQASTDKKDAPAQPAPPAVHEDTHEVEEVTEVSVVEEPAPKEGPPEKQAPK